MKIIDISVPINKNMIVWPGNEIPRLKMLSKIQGKSGHNESSIEMNIHTGTHLDAPLHFLPKGKSIDQLDTNIFVGRAFVINLLNVDEITADTLGKISLPKGTQRILFKTTNSSLWSKKNSLFEKRYVGITPDAAQWLVKNKIRLVGIDYLSIAKFDNACEVHQTLLKNGVVILEGINLSNVKDGCYELICLPLKITGAEGGPTRAVLIKK